MEERTRKDLVFVASALHDLRALPEDVRTVMGFALFQAQCGGKHTSAKPLKGFKGAGVLEVAEDADGDTYRTVYTVRFAGVIYVLHAFQKKSRRGIETPKRELDLVRSRLKCAEELHAARTRAKEG